MSHNISTNDYLLATDIHAYLIENRTLTRDKNNELFNAYTNEGVQSLVKLIAQRHKAKVELIKNTIYLIPDRDNKLLTYTKTELKKAIFKTSTYYEDDFNLANFVILELLTTLYNSTSEDLAMFQVSYSQFENRVSKSIDKASQYNLEELENEHNIAFINIINKWKSLKGSDGNTKSKDTRFGFMSKVLTFLNNEGLIDWYENDLLIVPTTKLTDLVTGVILNKSEFKKVEELFKQLKSEEHLTTDEESE